MSLYSSVSKNITNYFDTEYSVNLDWTSSNPDVLSDDGKYNPTDEDVNMTMTARLSAGNYFWEKEYTTVARAATEITGDPYSGLVAYYNFDEKPTYNVVNSGQSITYKTANSSNTAPTLGGDYSRFGNVCHQYPGELKYNSYARMANPLKDAADLSGFTVSMWVNRQDDTDYYGTLWGFFNSIILGTTGPRLYFTGNSYLGFNYDDDNWFDVNHPETKVVKQLKADTWSLITVTYSEENGYVLYLDGSKYLNINMKYTGSVAESEFDRTLVTDFVSTASYFYLGAGSFWGSADAYFDDLMIYNRELTADDVASLNTLLNRVNVFNTGEITAIDSPIADQSDTAAPQGIFDLTGRKVELPTRGIYIVNGKKVWIK